MCYRVKTLTLIITIRPGYPDEYGHLGFNSFVLPVQISVSEGG